MPKKQQHCAICLFLDEVIDKTQLEALKIRGKDRYRAYEANIPNCNCCLCLMRAVMIVLGSQND